MRPHFSDPALLRLMHHLNTSQALGALGERIAATALEQSGYSVRPPDERHCGDLRAVTDDGVILRVEVKTSRRTKDKKWRFTLRKEGHTDHANCDVVILLCVTRAGYPVPFVIPAADLQEKSHAVITSNPHTYAGKLAGYRQRIQAVTLD